VRQTCELSDILREYLTWDNSAKLPMDQLKVMSAISRCRTAELGGHVDACDNCGHLRISYNSCRNRHCPKCQGLNRESWVVMQEDMLLPVAYYHVVFTLPHELNLLCIYNPRELYHLLFSASWHVLNTLGKDNRWVGGQLSVTMLLHTWSQTLQLHPHIHSIVSNGGLNDQGNWSYPKRSKSNFLFPVNAMKKIYKGYFMEHLVQKIAKEQIIVPQNYYKENGGSYKKWKDALYKKDWVVYTKKPFSGVKHVIDYLGRYSHRVAITNGRIKQLRDQRVIFSYKDYKDNAKKKTMELSIEEFVRRFRLHILPSGLGQKHEELMNKAQRKEKALARLNINFDQCPKCKKGKMLKLMIISKTRPPPKL